MKKISKLFLESAYLYPLVFVMAPTLSLYAQNYEEVWLSSIFLPIFVSVLLLIASWLIFLLIFRNREKASIITSLWVIFFFSYNHLFRPFENFFINKKIYKISPVGPNGLLIIGIIAIATIINFTFFKDQKKLRTLTSFFNIAAIVILTINFFLIIPAEIKKTYDLIKLKNYKAKNRETYVIKNTNKQEYPDIYYFVFDRYANLDVLSEYFNKDNTKFINFLNEKNFYRAEKSRANYPETHFSLSSSLNMKYLNFLVSKELFDQRLPARSVIYSELLQDNGVVRFLKERGYKYVHVGSNWDGTKTNKLADKVYNRFANYNGVAYLVYEDTLANSFSEKYLDERFSSHKYFIETRASNLQFKTENIIKEASDRDPVFLFAHFILPHPPFIFDKNCNFSGFKLPSEETDEDYIEQVRCANKTIRILTEEIFKRAPRPFVIIIQSDEGPRIEGKESNYLIRSPIFNTIYLTPRSKDKGSFDYSKAGLYESISPVNTFRVIFNYYFGTDFKLLEDRSYTVKTKGKYSYFEDITDTLN